MKASLTNPIYTAAIVTKKGLRFDIKKITTDISLSDMEKDLSQKVNVSIVNIKYKGSHLTSHITVGDRMYVYCDTGEGAKEKFRGFIWDVDYESSIEKELKFTCYDHLIYLQSSKDNFYFTNGKSTESIISTICKTWGITLKYEYTSITHPKLMLRNQNISDSIIEVLEEARKRTGERYVISSVKDVLYIKRVAQNSKVYHLNRKENAINTKTKVTLDGMVTKVIITGNEKDSEREPVLATVNGNNQKTYGTLQDIVSKDSNTSLNDAKKEANELLKEKGKPFSTLAINAVDNPHINKGDMVKVSAGNLVGDYIVLSIEHDCMKKTMSLEVEKK